MGISGGAQTGGIHEHAHQAGRDEQRHNATGPDHRQPAEPLPERLFLCRLDFFQSVFTSHGVPTLLFKVDGVSDDAIASKLAPTGLVVTIFMGDLAAEHVVAPEGVTQDERDDDCLLYTSPSPRDS